jgi:hypothetical protein
VRHENELRAWEFTKGVTRGMAELRSVAAVETQRCPAQSAAAVRSAWSDGHKRDLHQPDSSEAARGADEGPEALRIHALCVGDNGANSPKARLQTSESVSLWRSPIKQGFTALKAFARAMVSAPNLAARRLGNRGRHPRRAVTTRARTS